VAKALGESPDAVAVAYNRTFQIDDRTAEEWKSQIEQNVESVVDYYMHLHPDVTDRSEAMKDIRENIRENREASAEAQSAAQVRDTISSAIGDGDEPDEETEREQETEEDEPAAAA
jgi:type I site-specific restriction-modification system R (restriction) subunit